MGSHTQTREEVEDTMEYYVGVLGAHLEHPGIAVVWTPGLIHAGPPVMGGHSLMGTGIWES